MSTAQRGLGRGLEALFGDGSPPAVQAPSSLPIDSIAPHPQQPRKFFAEEALADLAASIRSQGVVQPLLVRPVSIQPSQAEHPYSADPAAPSVPSGQPVAYELVAGERRWRAARMAGLTEVPVLVREMSDADVMLTALIENIQREDLTPLEEANALRTIRDHCSFTQEEMAEKLGKSRSSIANALRLLALSPQAQEDVQSGLMQAGHARALLSIPDMDAQEGLRCAVVEKKLTVREAEVAAMKWKRTGVFPWDKKAARLAGAQEASANDVSVSPDAPASPVSSDTPDTSVASSTPARTADANDVPEAQSAAPALHHTVDAPDMLDALDMLDSPRTQSVFEIHLAATVAQDFKAKATVIGDKVRGKVILSYSNTEEFQRVLHTLRIYPFVY